MKVLSKIPFADTFLTVLNPKTIRDEYDRPRAIYYIFHLPLAFYGSSNNSVMSGNLIFRDERKSIILPHTDKFLTYEEWENTDITAHNQFYTFNSTKSYLFLGQMEIPTQDITSTSSLEGRMSLDEVHFNLGKGRKPQHIRILV